MDYTAHELFVSTRDAERLSALLADSDGLAELLGEARFVGAERMPADRVAMGSIVTYEELPAGPRRTVTLAYPEEANAAAGRISVLSPIGLALIGRRRGAHSSALLPNGRTLRIRITELVAVSGYNPGRS